MTKTEIDMEDARQLAEDLYEGPCDRTPVRCLEVKHRNGRRKGFLELDPKHMCDSCAAYWHVERAAQILSHKVTLESKVTA